MRTLYKALAIGIPALLVSAFAARADWFHDEIPPPNAKPLSVIVKMVEDKGFRTISEVEFEDGTWEVEVQQGGKEIDLHVDPISGQIETK
mgnify:CR=1 FL=1